MVDERDGLADGDDGVEVVGVDDCRGVELVGDLGDEFVDEQGGFGVEAGVWLVEKEVAGIAGEGACYSGTFLHTAAQLRRIKFVNPFQINAFQTEIGAVVLLGIALFGEHV